MKLNVGDRILIKDWFDELDKNHEAVVTKSDDTFIVFDPPLVEEKGILDEPAWLLVTSFIEYCNIEVISSNEEIK